ncbi:hypothetical protein SAY87_018285 [Trapa incisa]|uniref:HTH La-type RNA-binding domain-containing protein n=1 Tax=Trapa incisa TaxID=236973 RepID=A0AAN7QWV7_9MYRT|nr:hypothetical protein SAY87_018285 [Trapa incisa]
MAAVNPSLSSSNVATASSSSHALWNKIPHPETIAFTVSSPPVAPVIELAIDSTASTGTAEAAAGGGFENISASNGNGGKEPAWSLPSSGPDAPSAMEAQSWPALSVSVNSPTEPSLVSVEGLADGLSSMSISQVTGSASPQNQPANQRHRNLSVSHHPFSTGQRSMGQNGAAFSGGVLPQMPPLLEQSGEMRPRLSPGHHNPRSNFASQSHGGNNHPWQHRNSYRNHNSGIYPRGASFNHYNLGGRHDQLHGNREWTSNRNFGNSRDQQQNFIPGPIRPPPPPPIPYAPFMPSSIWPYNQIGYPGVTSLPYYVPVPAQDLRGVPFPLSPQSVYVPASDPFLPMMILNQIEYYFSVENLIKDTFLRQNMDGMGWVPIRLIAGFRKVSNLTDNINLILNSLQSSTVVEVQGDKVRKRNDWMRWIIPSSFQAFSSAAPQA